MARWILFFIKVALVVAIAVWFSNNRAEVRINWAGTDLEETFGVSGLMTELWVFVLAILMIALLIDFAIRLIRGTERLPGRLAGLVEENRRIRGYRALTQGLVAVAAGDREMAAGLARRADRLLRDPPLTRLLSAQAAQLNGDESAAERYFTEMLNHKETAFLGARGLLMIATRRHDYATALAMARRSHELQPGSQWVLSQLIELECRAGDFARAEALVRRAGANGTLRQEEARSLLAGVLTERARLAAAAGNFDGAADLLRQAISSQGSFVPAYLDIAVVKKRLGQQRAAEKLIERAWRSEAHPELARAWMVLAPSDVQGRYRWAQRLGEGQPQATVTHATIAAAALDAGQLADARRHLEQIRAPDRSRGVWSLVLALEQASGGIDSASRLGEGLRHSADAPPDATWRCLVTGVDQSEWSLISRGDAFNSVAWVRPGEAAGTTRPLHDPAAP